MAASGVSSWAQLLLVATILSSVFMGGMQLLRIVHAYRLPRTQFPVERLTTRLLTYMAAIFGEWARLLCPRPHREQDKEQEQDLGRPPLPSSSLLGVRVSSIYLILFVCVVLSKISDFLQDAGNRGEKKNSFRIKA